MISYFILPSKVDKPTLVLRCIIVCTLQPSNVSGEPSCKFSSTSKEKKKYESRSDKNIMKIQMKENKMDLI